MIDWLKPYPEYKESGLSWLGDVPAHWNVRRLKQICRLAYGDSLPMEARQKGIVPVFGSNGSVGFHSSSNTIAPCIVLGRKGSFGKVNFSSVPVFAIDTTFFIDNRFTNAEVRWLFYLLDWLRLDAVSKDSAVPGLDQEDAYQRIVVVPPPDEQTAIVRFLDYMNRRVERFIWAKKKVIALLNEQKQTIIQRAVTRGLDPNVPLKSSGIPWLGDIPEHWEVKRIKYLLREVDYRSTTGSETLLSMRMRHGLVPFAEHFSRPPQAATFVGFKVVYLGYLVVNRMQAGNGLIFPSHLTGLVSPDYAVFAPIADVNVDFLGELFRSRMVRAKFRAESKGLGTGTSGFLRLYNDRFSAIHIAVPPRPEQETILAGLGEQLREINDAIGHTEHQIALLKEYRTRLIADVVTGKLDVREAVAKLPDEAEEPEPINETDALSDAGDATADDLTTELAEADTE